MKAILPASAFVLIAAFPTLSPASIVYSNLSPGQTYNDGTGNSLDYPGPLGFAVRFNPATDFDLTDIDLGVTHISGANEVKAELLSDASGLPGGVIQAWTVSGLPTFGTVHSIQPSQSIAGITGISLGAGTNYWLAVFPGNSPSRAAWNHDNYPTSNQGSVGYMAQSADGSSSWQSPGLSDGVGALEIRGILAPVPLSGALSMMLGSLAALSFLGRRKTREAP